MTRLIGGAMAAAALFGLGGLGYRANEAFGSAALPKPRKDPRAIKGPTKGGYPRKNAPPRPSAGWLARRSPRDQAIIAASHVHPRHKRGRALGQALAMPK